jgi:hypothetical protein
LSFSRTNNSTMDTRRSHNTSFMGTPPARLREVAAPMETGPARFFGQAGSAKRKYVMVAVGVVALLGVAVGGGTAIAAEIAGPNSRLGNGDYDTVPTKNPTAWPTASPTAHPTNSQGGNGPLPTAAPTTSVGNNEVPTESPTEGPTMEYGEGFCWSRQYNATCEGQPYFMMEGKSSAIATQEECEEACMDRLNCFAFVFTDVDEEGEGVCDFFSNLETSAVSDEASCFIKFPSGGHDCDGRTAPPVLQATRHPTVPTTSAPTHEDGYCWSRQYDVACYGMDAQINGTNSVANATQEECEELCMSSDDCFAFQVTDEEDERTCTWYSNLVASVTSEEADCFIKFPSGGHDCDQTTGAPVVAPTRAPTVPTTSAPTSHWCWSRQYYASCSGAPHEINGTSVVVESSNECEELCMDEPECAAFQYFNGGTVGSGGFDLVDSGACYFYSDLLISYPHEDADCYIKFPSGGFECPPKAPTSAPTATMPPSTRPTGWPTHSPTAWPTESPTAAPTASPTMFPTSSPTNAPSTTVGDGDAVPTSSPTASPVASTKQPTTEY